MARWSGWCPGCLLPTLLTAPGVALAQSASGFDADGVTTIRVGAHADDAVSHAVRLASGVATLPPPSTGAAVAVHPSGGVMLAGTTGPGTRDVVVARFTEGGVLDAGYGDGGTATGS